MLLANSKNQIANYEVKVKENRAIFEWCIRNVQQCLHRGTLEEAMQWSGLGGYIAYFREGIGLLNSPEMEGLLLQIGQNLPAPARELGKSHQRRWLHVLTKAYSNFGHTALVKRWLEQDKEQSQVTVVLLSQHEEAPAALAEVVRNKGGRLLQFNSESAMLDRARQLREEAWANADVVVLHAHPDDPIPMVAFAIEGGPPVLLLNHADHAFWYGGSIADRVINIRKSGQLWGGKYRGIERNVILPMPLEDSIPLAEAVILRERFKSRQTLNLPEDAAVLLTIGQAYKYNSTPFASFIEAAEDLLKRCPNAYLIAVGPPLINEWRSLHKAVEGRVLAMGLQKDLAPYLAAADVYLEGFPFSSLTALLEAGLAGLPCVRAPQLVPPTLSSDDAALDCIEQPLDAAGYIEKAVSLLQDATRVQQGHAFAERIRQHHCGEGWQQHLQEVIAAVPRTHKIYPLEKVLPFPERYQLYWTALRYVEHRYGAIETIVKSIVEGRLQLSPTADAMLWQDLCSVHQQAATSPAEPRLESQQLSQQIALQNMTAQMSIFLTAYQCRCSALEMYGRRDFLQVKRYALQSFAQRPRSLFEDRLLVVTLLKACLMRSPLKNGVVALRSVRTSLSRK